MGLKLISGLRNVIGAGVQGVNQATASAFYKEYFESGAMNGGILMKRGQRVSNGQASGRKNFNTAADDNLISNGSIIDVQSNQCMIVVNNGKIADVCTEPGRYQFDTGDAPSIIFGGKENNSFAKWGKDILNQWSTGGVRYSTQRVYFINMAEMAESPIKWGCGNIPFHNTQVVNSMERGVMPFELDIQLRGNGELTFQITDPIMFFNTYGSKLSGGDNNGIIRITDSEIVSNLKSNIANDISVAISKLSHSQQVSYTAVMAHFDDIRDYLNESLNKRWAGQRGFSVCQFSINDGGLNPTEESMKKIDAMQMTQSFAGMNYATQNKFIDHMGELQGANGMMFAGAMFGGGNMGNIQPMNTPFVNGQQQQPVQPVGQQAPVPPTTPAEPPKDTWTCSCGVVNDGNFCKGCGQKKPEPVKPTGPWVCECGVENTGNFCKGCGKKRPEARRKFKCDKCGWEGESEEDLRFCPNCGDPVTEADFV